MLLLAPLLLGPLATPLTAPQDEELLSLWIADAETFLTDPKDAALLNALRLVDDRVLELAGEIPGFPPLPPEAIQLGAHLLTGQKSLRLLSSTDPELMVPVYAQLELQEGDADAARALAGGIVSLGQSLGLPLAAAGEDGRVSIENPAGIPIHLGAHDTSVVLSVGKAIEGAGAPLGGLLPDGVSPNMSMRMDVGKTLDLVTGLMAMGSPEEAESITRMAEAFGLHGMIIEAAMGSDAERSYSATRMPGYAAVMREIGLMPARGLTAADLKMIPSDAVWASVGTIEAQGMLDYMHAMFAEELADAGVEDPIEMLAAATGFHLQADLLDHLGTSLGIYTSDTTGGGGLLSLVAFIELSNPEGMRGTMLRMQEVIDGLGTAEADGYVRSRIWSVGETELMSVVFPGLPIPFEPTIAVSEHHLLFGITPQATLAAIGQASSDDGGLLANEAFRQNLSGSAEGAYSLTFMDTPRLVADGYGLTSLICSAIVNGTRSRVDVERDAGNILPSYRELTRGARATVSVTRVVGEDFVSESRGDRSMLVSVAGTLGAVGSSPIALLVPAMFLGLTTARMEASQAATEWEIIEDDFEEDF